LRLLDILLLENKIDLAAFGLDPLQDLLFIKECIAGVRPGQRKGGREGVRSFLYDIVNNTRSGLDVDKVGGREGETVGGTVGGREVGREGGIKDKGRGSLSNVSYSYVYHVSFIFFSSLPSSLPSSLLPSLPPSLSWTTSEGTPKCVRSTSRPAGSG
jgi:hypothetical protein